MKYGYARVSTDGQRLDAQVKPLCSTGARKVFREALVQSCLFEANSFKPVLKNQWLASPDFPDLCTLHQSHGNNKRCRRMEISHNGEAI
jgi:hypothetical protein